MQKSKGITLYAMMIAFIGSIGGLLFGYNTGVIAGTLIIFSELFQLTLAQKANVVSILILGALIGAIGAGFISDRMGRKKTVMMSAVIYLIGGTLLTFSHSVTTLVIGRFVTGLGVGFGSLIVPLYLSEIAPTKYRGALVSTNQLMITSGFLLSFILNAVLDLENMWRWLFIVSCSFAFVQFIGMFFLPESPNWLIGQNKIDQARTILKDVRGDSDVEEVIQSVKKADEATKSSLSLTVKKTPLCVGGFLKQGLLGALVVGVGISMIQQLTGINAIFYYAPTIFREVGFITHSTAMLATISLGLINVLATIFAMWLIDIKGRRPLLLTGLSGMFIGLVSLAFCFLFGKGDLSWLSLISALFYVFFFAISLGPITWVIISEIFPLAVRGRVMSICIFSNWAMNYLVSLTFLPITKSFGGGVAFLMFALITAISFFFVYYRVPETRGKSLEEIANFWKK
ncbi:MAG: sugar porter family MFS transporter [Simkaniaceae bacterium]|nr:sugar porter family MFS transporter [Simkaniaceae bacterium]